jgi:hypothetical protein
MNKKYKIPCLAGMILLVAACQKHVNVVSDPAAQLSFFNASEYVLGQTLNTSGFSFLLIDAKDTTHSGVGGPSIASTPSFSGGQYQFPNFFYYTRQPVSWISYMRVHPGLHTVTLTDTGGHHSLMTTAVKTAQGNPVSVYYSDSLGVFRSWTLIDTVSEISTAVKLRVFDLSPDAGNVFFTIGGRAATGFPDSLRYGQITGFVPWDNPVADTLQFRFFNTGDSVDIIASGSLSVMPGHAYNVLLTGYMSSQFFLDTLTGSYLNFNPDLKLLFTQNN